MFASARPTDPRQVEGVGGGRVGKAALLPSRPGGPLLVAGRASQRTAPIPVGKARKPLGGSIPGMVNELRAFSPCASPPQRQTNGWQRLFWHVRDNC